MKITFTFAETTPGDLSIIEVTDENGRKGRYPYPFKIQCPSLGINEEFANLTSAILFLLESHNEQGIGIVRGARAYYTQIPGRGNARRKPKCCT